MCAFYENKFPVLGVVHAANAFPINTWERLTLFGILHLWIWQKQKLDRFLIPNTLFESNYLQIVCSMIWKHFCEFSANNCARANSYKQIGFFVPGYFDDIHLMRIDPSFAKYGMKNRRAIITSYTSANFLGLSWYILFHHYIIIIIMYPVPSNLWKLSNPLNLNWIPVLILRNWPY